MAVELIKREILPNLKDFKSFWKKEGPFKYALTSIDFPFVLLEDEEWIFSNDSTSLLKALMQFDKQKMKIVKSPFNPDNRAILRPEELSAWKIKNFPEEWNSCVCDLFVPEGHLTKALLEKIDKKDLDVDAKQVETIFFQSLETAMESLGYLLLKPEGTSKYAATKKYLSEWEKDEQDAGLF